MQAAGAYYQAARRAGRGTTWLAHLTDPARQVSITSQTGVDLLDTVAATNIVAALTTVGQPSRFEQLVVQTHAALSHTPARPYEQGLVDLGTLAGASDTSGNNKATAAPDATWIFGDLAWICWEAKSEANPDGELGTNVVTQAGGHLRWTADARDAAVPSDSSVFLLSPQRTIHPAAHAVAENHVYLIRPDQVVELFERLARAWRKLRTRDANTLGLDVAVALLGEERALPSQWLTELRRDCLARSDDAP